MTALIGRGTIITGLFVRSLFSVALMLTWYSVTSTGQPLVCDPKGFRKNTARQDNRAIQLAFAYRATKEQWDNAKRSGSGGGSLFGASLGGSFEEYKSNVQKEAAALNIAFSDQSSLSYSEAGLDAEGRKGYEACLDSERGKPRLVMGERMSSSATVILRYFPSGDSGPSTWTIDHYENIKNIRQIDSIIMKLKGGTPIDNKPITVELSNPRKAANITVGYGGQGAYAYIPPVIEQRPPSVTLPQRSTGAQIANKKVFIVSFNTEPYLALVREIGQEAAFGFIRPVVPYRGQYVGGGCFLFYGGVWPAGQQACGVGHPEVTFSIADAWFTYDGEKMVFRNGRLVGSLILINP